MNEEYYLNDSEEVIVIVDSHGNMNLRPIEVEGMRRHHEDILAVVRATVVWSITVLRKIEGW